MTTFGKILVYLNTFMAVVLFGWALSLYTNRVDWFDRTLADGTKIDGQLTLLGAEIKRHSEQVKASQGAYVANSERVRYTESVRDFRKGALAAFMKKIQGVDDKVRFLDLNRLEKSALIAFPSTRGTDGNFDPQGTVVNGLDGKPLRGLGNLRKSYGELSQDMLARWARILKYRADYAALCDQIDIVQYEVIRQKAIFDNLKDEQDYLTDARINWEEQLRTLEVRKSQLLIRLDALGVTPRTGSKQ